MSLRILLSAALVSALAACSGGGGGTGPGDVPPVITVTGVTDGASYDSPVTVAVSVDRGSYTVTLDGQPFISPSTVSGPGEHVLQVDARAGTATSSRTVRFTVRVAGRVLIVRMFDLGDNESGGGGDAILLTDSSGAGMRHGLIDAGPQGVNASNPGYVATRLQQLGVARLDFVQLTHAHADHYAGLGPVLNAIPTTRFVYNGQLRSVTSYSTVITTAQARADSVIVVSATRPLPLGADVATLQVVPPLGQTLAIPTSDNTQLNEESLGTSLARGTFRMFFTGDGEVLANQRWRTQFPALTGGLTALKAGHHGANNGVFDNGFNGSSSWLAHTAPRLILVSANGRTHPRRNALSFFLGLPQADTYCTSVHGDITVRVAETGQYTVTVQRNAALDCVPGSEATT